MALMTLLDAARDWSVVIHHQLDLWPVQNARPRVTLSYQFGQIVRTDKHNKKMCLKSVA
jgi:hypothetical protein